MIRQFTTLHSHSSKTPRMEAASLYWMLAGATCTSVLVAPMPWEPVRLVRHVTGLASYLLLIGLVFLDPLWRVLSIWGSAALVTGTICYAYERWTIRRAVRGPFAEAAEKQNHWWLVPVALLGWPDMLPYVIEAAILDWQLFGHREKQSPSEAKEPQARQAFQPDQQSA
jgi:Zn-dependent protease with chaperone function